MKHDDKQPVPELLRMPTSLLSTRLHASTLGPSGLVCIFFFFWGGGVCASLPQLAAGDLVLRVFELGACLHGSV